MRETKPPEKDAHRTHTRRAREQAPLSLSGFRGHRGPCRGQAASPKGRTVAEVVRGPGGNCWLAGHQGGRSPGMERAAEVLKSSLQ